MLSPSPNAKESEKNNDCGWLNRTKDWKPSEYINGMFIIKYIKTNINKYVRVS